MVCEAKRQLWNECPDLRERIDFGQDVHREDVINRLRKLIKEYGGNFYLALQMNVPSGTMSGWNRGINKPGIEMLKVLLSNIMRGFLKISCLEDAQFILMCRAILGGSPEEFFPGVTDFASARQEFLRPYPRHTAVKIESRTGIKENTISRLLEWKPEKGKTSCFPETVEGILRALVERSYPALVETFDEHRKTYRKKEDVGIWSVDVPLKDLMESKPAKKTRVATPVVEKAVKPVPVPPPVSVHEPIAHPKESVRDVLIGGLRDLLLRLEATPDEVVAIPSSTTTPIYEPIGSVMNGVEHCLNPNTWHLRKDERVTKEKIEDVRTAIVHLRKVLVAMSELNPDIIRKNITPILGPELAELFVAHEGLHHLMGSQAAWEIVQGTRSMVGVASEFNKTKGGK